MQQSLTRPFRKGSNLLKKSLVLANATLLSLLLAYLPAKAGDAKSGGVGASPGGPRPVTNGTAEMKWKKVPGIPYVCKSGEQICICKTGSDVIDCRKALPPVKEAD